MFWRSWSSRRDRFPVSPLLRASDPSTGGDSCSGSQELRWTKWKYEISFLYNILIIHLCTSAWWWCFTTFCGGMSGSGSCNFLFMPLRTGNCRFILWLGALTTSRFNSLRACFLLSSIVSTGVAATAVCFFFVFFFHFFPLTLAPPRKKLERNTKSFVYYFVYYLFRRRACRRKFAPQRCSLWWSLNVKTFSLVSLLSGLLNPCLKNKTNVLNEVSKY